MSYFKLPSLWFRRRKKAAVDLETLFLLPKAENDPGRSDFISGAAPEEENSMPSFGVPEVPAKAGVQLETPHVSKTNAVSGRGQNGGDARVSDQNPQAAGGDLTEDTFAERVSLPFPDREMADTASLSEIAAVQPGGDTHFPPPQERGETVLSRQHISDSPAPLPSAFSKAAVPEQEAVGGIFRQPSPETVSNDFQGTSLPLRQTDERISANVDRSRQEKMNFFSDRESMSGRNADRDRGDSSQLGAAVGVLTDCVKTQLRYLRKNYELLKSQSEDRFFN